MEKNDTDNNLEELAGIAKAAIAKTSNAPQPKTQPETPPKGNQGLRELAGIIEDNDNDNDNDNKNDATNASAE